MQHSLEEDGIRNEDFPEVVQGVVERIGIAATLAVLEELGGAKVYIPKADSVFQSIARRGRDASIRADFNGYNQHELSRKYRLSEEWIRQILLRTPREQA